MESKNFVYWLQGLFELSDSKTLNEDQVTKIKNHLKLVFLYDIDPSYSDDSRLNAIFQNIHDGKEPFEGIDIRTKSEKPNNKFPIGGSKLRC
jgi:hypothetical protein